jgi:hypothetical protein
MHHEPLIDRVDKLRLEPGETVVLTSERFLSADQRARLRETLRALWPGNDVVVLDPNMTLEAAPHGAPSHEG